MTAAGQALVSRLSTALADIEAQGLTKPERVLATAQGAKVRTAKGQDALNFCANNYLGLGADPRVVAAGKAAADRWGAGLASVRFICGTQELHKELERAIADYLGYEDAILFGSAFDANGAVFEPLLEADDAIVSDALNHASIIDGIRLAKAKRFRFANRDMGELEQRLKEARQEGAKQILIASDGVFSMDGYVADLKALTALAAKYEALVMVDDAHATGVIGERGRGSASATSTEGKTDILTGTLGKALGGAMGGFIAARREVVAYLRQRARPYLFSNSLAPFVAGASLEAIRISNSDEGDALRNQLRANAANFRARMAEAGFSLLPGDHPIIPVMIGDALKAQKLAAKLIDNGVFVTAFSFPVVPQGAARIRTQLCANHTDAHIEQAVAAFTKAGRELGIVS